LGTAKYALVGAFSGGLFFSRLNASGGLVGTSRFWQSSAGEYPRYRPSIWESTFSSGIFYICAEFGHRMYAIKYNANTGAIAWQWKSPSGLYIDARDIIEDPNTGDVVVVGRVDPPAPNTALAAEAFFMKLNPSTGAIVQFDVYSDGGNGDGWFTSIEIANSPNYGGSGFIIGGREHHTAAPNNTAWKPWMVKMDPNGNVLWSTFIQHSTAADPLEIYDVVERHNTVTGNTYEYFGVAHTPKPNVNPALAYDGMAVWKLDDAGSDTYSPNEFLYELNSGSPPPFFSPTQIEIIGTGTAAGDGIQIFSTDQVNSDHIMFGAYFNGVTGGCDVPSDWTAHTGPGYWISLSMTPVSLSPCIYLTVTQVANAVTPVDHPNCNWSSSAGGGSNARSAATSIQHYIENSNNLSLYPNPANKSFTLQFKHEGTGPVQISILNSLGQIEKRTEISKDTNNEFVIDFEALQLSEGLYFVTVNNNKEIYTSKVIYKK
jgi:hypothetical protein